MGRVPTNRPPPPPPPPLDIVVAKTHNALIRALCDARSLNPNYEWVQGEGKYAAAFPKLVAIKRLRTFVQNRVNASEEAQGLQK